MGQIQDRLDEESRLVQQAIESGVPSDNPRAKDGYGFCVRGTMIAAGTMERIFALSSPLFSERACAVLWYTYIAGRPHRAWDDYEIVEVKLDGYLVTDGDAQAKAAAEEYGLRSPIDGLRRYLADRLARHLADQGTQS